MAASKHPEGSKERYRAKQRLAKCLREMEKWSVWIGYLEGLVGLDIARNEPTSHEWTDAPHAVAGM
jgi:hypothetical protein